MQPGRDTVRDGVAAGAVAGLVSGAPSTLHALATGRDPLEPSRAAGSLLRPGETRTGRLLAAAGVVHGGLSLGWGLVLAAVLPRRPSVAVGAAAGGAIAALDLGVVGRRCPRVRALPLLPQVADHVAYGVAVAAVIRRRRRSVGVRAQRARGQDGPGRLPPPVLVAATEVVPASREQVFGFLAAFENHCAIAGRFIEVVSLDRPAPDAPADGGVVRVRGPLGIARTARTRVVTSDRPSRIAGTAALGEGTRARVEWTLEPCLTGTRVRLAATVERATPLDTAVLRLGGLRWLRGRFAATVGALASAVGRAGGVS